MKKFLLALIVLFLIGVGIGYYAYNNIFSPNVLIDESSKTITITSGSSFEDVVSLLKKNNILKDSKSFVQTSKWMKYGTSGVPPGKYKIEPNWSNKQLISLLRSGRQTPVKITFNNLRTKEDLAGKISSYLEIDSSELLQFFNSETTLTKTGYNSANFISLFIPNTYEFYWNVSKEKLLDRMISENEKFWKRNKRISKASSLNMTRAEVITLASIVEKESLRKDEKPIIAGVYLNRIKTGIPLQADPTVVFGIGDFTLRRVLNKHLEYDTPYNTYLHLGLPPGPICMPSITSIDAVLNYKKHNYIYFCAKPESNGGHLFASSLAQHNANARVYHRWLDKRGIR